jgi:nitrogen fixation protein FixH
MKTSWGIKLIIAFTVFAAGIITMAVISFSNNTELVSENYYEQEVKYQDRIDILKNSKTLDENIFLNYKNDSIYIELSENARKNNLNGEIYFYRASDLKKDFRIEFKPGENGIQTVSVKGLEKGIWKLKMNLNDTKNKYFIEKNIFINRWN